MSIHLRSLRLVVIFLGGLAVVRAQLPSEPVGWKVGVGGGIFMAPAFPGAKDYQLMAVPGIRVAYGDVFFASVEQGAGYLFRSERGWAAGPFVKIDFGRNADGESPFRIAGRRTDALRGFADVDTTMQVGALVTRTWDAWRAKLELLQGANGHEGFTGTLSLDYSIVLAPAGTRRGPPTIFSTGPRLLWGSTSYNNAYFGVSPTASLGSGLSEYSAGSGPASAGWAGSMIRSLNSRLTLVGIVAYDRPSLRLLTRPW